MQNWNPWQVPAGTVTAPMPPTPAGYTAPGADPMAMMQSYMQYYNQPAPSGYTAEQWAAAQQQNWGQWQQWQQQFQQWQAQYGEKYQETMKQLSAQGLTLTNVTQAPPLPNSQPPPPLPKEEKLKPPLPPDSNNPYQYANVPPPHQNNLPLFPAKSQSGNYNSGNVATFSLAPPLPPGHPPPPTSNPQEPPSVNQLGEKRGNNEPVDFGSAKKNKFENEELTEAEKTFDAQFKQWEEQFNKWKQQNANHPDKTQYKEYEAKWTSWREKLIERREQMRKKREQQKQSAKAESEKNKSISGGDKILNILSNSENQSLINNLLGIGKTLGLTGKQEAERPSTSSVPASTVPPLPHQSAPMIAPTMTTDMTQAAWAAQQWAAQYTTTMGMQNYAGFQLVPGMAPPPVASQAQPSAGNNFSQPPPNLSNPGMNFSQPPPGFGPSDSMRMPAPEMKQNQRNMHDRPPSFASDSDKRDSFGGNEQFRQGIDHSQSTDNRSDHNSDRFAPSDRGSGANQFVSSNYRPGGDTQKNDFGAGNRGGGNQFGFDNERFNQAADQFGGNRQGDFGNNERGGSGSQFRIENDSFGSRSDRFRQEYDRFGNSKEGDSGNSRFSRDNDSFAPSNDRFGPNDRLGLGNNRLGRDGGSFGSGNDRFGLSNDRLGSDIDRFSSNTNRFGSSSINDQFGPASKDRFGSGNDRFGSSNDRTALGNERFDSGNSRFGPGGSKDNCNKGLGFNDNFGPGNDRLASNDRSNIPDPFESKDLNYMSDNNRRDSFGDNSRGINRNVRPFENSDSIAPELKKLMEKRRAAMNVFKPRDDVFNPVKQNNIGSLSESFKKITGESPYTSRYPGDFGPKGHPGIGPRSFDNTMSRGPGDFGPRGLGSFHGNTSSINQQSLSGMEFGSFKAPVPDRLRSRGEFGGFRNEFGPSRVQGNFGPRGRGDFEFGMKNDRLTVDQPGNLTSRNKGESSVLEQSQSFDIRSKDRPNNEHTQTSMPSSTHERGDNVLQKEEKPQPECPLNNVLPLERPPWMDVPFSEQHSNDNANDVKNSPGLRNSSSATESAKPDNFNNVEARKSSALVTEKSAPENNDQEIGNENENQQINDSEKSSLPLGEGDGDGKNQNTLPFMGENDPKPEDLNMEPPPELPNLGPVREPPNLPTFRSNVQDSDRPPRSITQRGPNSPYFDAPGQCKPGGPSIEPFGPRGPNVNRFEPRGPNDSKFGPRNPNDIPFGPRGPHFGPRGPNNTQFGPRGPNDNQFGPRGPNDNQFGPRGPNVNQFGPRGPNDNQFGPRGPNVNQFGPRGPNDNQFGPRGPNDNQFGPRGPNDNHFGPKGPNDNQFGPRGPNDNQFGPRGPNDNQFGPRGPSESQFGPRGLGDGQFGPKDHYDNPANVHPQRAPKDGLLGLRPGDEQFGLMGRGFPPPRGPGVGHLGQRPLNDPPFASLRGPNQEEFRLADGNHGLQGPNDGKKPAIPSLLGLHFDKQPNFEPSNAQGNILNQGNRDFERSGINVDENKTADGRRPFGVNEPDRKLQFSSDHRPQFGPGSQYPAGRPLGPEQRPPFVQGLPEQRLPFERDTSGDAGNRSPFKQGGPMSNEQRPLNSQCGTSLKSPHAQGGLDQRLSFSQSGARGPAGNSSITQGGFGTFEPRIEPNVTEKRSPFGPGGPGNLDQQMARGREQRSNFDNNLRGTDQQARKGIIDPVAGASASSQFDPGFHDRSRDLSDHRRPQQGSPNEEFCVGKQFNYNHGGGVFDEKISEIIPNKVIDYGHATKVIVHEYITPAQCFDYGHGHLKPVVPEHEVIPQRDFRHWEDTEQSLKEYDDRLRLYAGEHHWQGRTKLKDNSKVERSDSKEREFARLDRDLARSERRSLEAEERRSDRDRESRGRRERDNKEERKERDHDRERAREDRDREYGRDLDREDRHRRDGNDNKDKNRDRGAKNDRSDRNLQNKEHNREDDRSKGNVSRQEYQNKNNAITSTPESSTSEAKNDSTETTSKKMQLPKMPNYTMVDDILFQPGRQTRPPKIVIILRGPPGSGKSFVAKLIKDKEVEQGGSAPRILSLDDYFLVEKEKETKDDNGKKVVVKEMAYEYEEAMEQSYLASLVKAFKKNITDGYFNFIILDCINEKISDYEEMWSFAKTKGFQVYVCEMEMDVHICMKRNIHNRSEEEVNKIVDYFEPTPNHHLKLDVNAMLQEEAIDEVHMEDSQQSPEETAVQGNDDSQDSQDDKVGVSKWEKMDADNKLDRLDGLAKKKNESRPQTMEDFLQVPDYYNMEDTSGKKRVRWADLEERKEQEKLRAVGFVVGHTNWDRMMDPTQGQSALTRTKYI